MNKDYHNAKKVLLGSSDSARLTVTDNKGTKRTLKFGEDGSYYAYCIPLEDAEEFTLPDYYKWEYTFSDKITISDDYGETVSFIADTIKIARAGNFGCIVTMGGGNRQIIHL